MSVRSRIVLVLAVACIAYGVMQSLNPHAATSIANSDTRSERPRTHMTGGWIEIERTDSGVLLADTNGVEAGDPVDAAVFMKFVRSTPTAIPGTEKRVAAVVGTQEVNCRLQTHEMLDAAALDSAGQPLAEMNALRGQRGALGPNATPLCDYIRRHASRSAERLLVDQWVRQEVSRTDLDAIAVDTVSCAEGALQNGIVPVLAFVSAHDEHIGDTTMIPVVYVALGVARPVGGGRFTFDSAAHYDQFRFKVRAGANGRLGILCGHIPWNHMMAAEFDKYRDRLDANSMAKWDSVYRKTPAEVTFRNLMAKHRAE